jgi:hypothetical protein
MDPQPRKKRQSQDKKKSKGPYIYSGKHVRLSLVAKGDARHALLNSKDVVVHGVHPVK